MANKESDYLDSFFKDDSSGSDGTGKKTSGMSPAFEKAYKDMNSAKQTAEAQQQRSAASGQNRNASKGKQSSVLKNSVKKSSSRKKVRSSEDGIVLTEKNVLTEKERRFRYALTVASGIFSWVKEILVALVLVWLFLTFIAQSYSVIGGSMSPTLRNGDRVIVNKLVYRFWEPSRGDIVVFHYDDDSDHDRLIKRVVGLPGDEIIINEGVVFINGAAFDESKYLSIPTDEPGSVSYPYVVPENTYFVMGDNRINSKDSRFFGAVSKSDLIGRAFFRFWPFSSFGFLD